MLKTFKICAGEYVVRDTTEIRPSRQVRVTKVRYPGDGEYWIAAPDFDNNTSDPLPTKRDAVKAALRFLTRPDFSGHKFCGVVRDDDTQKNYGK